MSQARAGCWKYRGVHGQKDEALLVSLPCSSPDVWHVLYLWVHFRYPLGSTHAGCVLAPEPRDLKLSQFCCLPLFFLPV